MSLWRFLFGCSHAHLTRPFTLKRGGITYIICLDCGSEFPYDWESMRIADVD